MKSKVLVALFLLILSSTFTVAQEKEDHKKKERKERKQESSDLDPLVPSKTAFLSSVVPGLGQIKNKKYWKVPIVYAGMGIPAYLWVDNQRFYTRYRNEYKRRLQGIHDVNDPVFGKLDNQRLLDAQTQYRRNRDLSVVVTVGFYILSIVDANVDAHLSQFNVNDNLTIRPVFEINPNLDLHTPYQYAINIQYKF